MIDRFGPGVGDLNYLAVPGVGIFEFLFVPVTTNHFPDGEFQLYLTSHFCLGVGNLTAIFLENVKIPPYAPPRASCFISFFVFGIPDEDTKHEFMKYYFKGEATS